MSVGITVNGDRRHAHLLRSPDHPARDFPPIGDQDFREDSTSTSTSRVISVDCRRSLPDSGRTLGREAKHPRGVSKMRAGSHSVWPQQAGS